MKALSIYLEKDFFVNYSPIDVGLTKTKLIFSKNPNSVICVNIGGFHSSPGDLATIRPLETIHLTYNRLLATA